jgi:hypothetical protein
MSTFLVAFVGSLVGGVLAGLLGHWADARYRQPSVQLGAAAIERFPRPLLLTTAAATIFVAWSSIVALLTLLGVNSAGLFHSSESLVVSMLGVALGCVPLQFLLAFTLRCAKCHRQVLSQMSSNPPHAEKIWQMDGWSSVVVRVLFSGSFRCMHCGQRYFVRESSR